MMSEQIQARVAQVFAEFLEIPTVAVDDDLFQLGGDSFVAVQVTLELERLFDMEIPLDALESASTVRGIAAWIGRQSEHAIGGGPGRTVGVSPPS